MELSRISKGRIQMMEKHFENFSTSLTIRDIKTKIAFKFYLTLVIIG